MSGCNAGVCVFQNTLQGGSTEHSIAFIDVVKADWQHLALLLSWHFHHFVLTLLRKIARLHTDIVVTDWHQFDTDIIDMLAVSSTDIVMADWHHFYADTEDTLTVFDTDIGTANWHQYDTVRQTGCIWHWWYVQLWHTSIILTLTLLRQVDSVCHRYCQADWYLYDTDIM